MKKNQSSLAALYTKSNKKAVAEVPEVTLEDLREELSVVDDWGSADILNTVGIDSLPGSCGMNVVHGLGSQDSEAQAAILLGAMECGNVWGGETDIPLLYSSLTGSLQRSGKPLKQLEYLGPLL